MNPSRVKAFVMLYKKTDRNQSPSLSTVSSVHFSFLVFSFLSTSFSVLLVSWSSVMVVVVVMAAVVVLLSAILKIRYNEGTNKY